MNILKWVRYLLTWSCHLVCLWIFPQQEIFWLLKDYLLLLLMRSRCKCHLVGGITWRATEIFFISRAGLPNSLQLVVLKFSLICLQVWGVFTLCFFGWLWAEVNAGCCQLTDGLQSVILKVVSHFQTLRAILVLLPKFIAHFQLLFKLGVEKSVHIFVQSLLAWWVVFRNWLWLAIWALKFWDRCF